eukprot:10234869-Lingulodinium_polyedra.AAC.1
MGMDADAVGMVVDSCIHRKAEMRVSPRRNERLNANLPGQVRRSNGVNAGMDRPGIVGSRANQVRGSRISINL